MLRIRSEHAIGFLKGRFHSLKHLRVNISDETSHKIATYWVSTCVGIHSFAMERKKSVVETLTLTTPTRLLRRGCLLLMMIRMLSQKSGVARAAVTPMGNVYGKL